LNVLLLTQFFSTTKGGGEYVFSLIAKNLAKNGHKVWVITNKITNEIYENQSNIQINFVKPDLEYKGGLPLGLLDNLRYSFNAFFAGLSLIKKEKIDIIHSNNFSPSLVGSFLSLFTSKPHIMTVHDVFSLYDKDFSKKWAQQANVSKASSMLIPFFEKLMIHFRHGIMHTVSDATKDDLKKLGEKKPIHVIENSVESFSSNSDIVDPFQIIYVGRLVFYKNLEVILKAIPIIKQKIPKIKLVIVGDGPYKENLESLIKKLDINENVDLKGYLSTQEKFQLISQSMALVFPSLVEGFGLVILEAFSQRRPVIVSNVRPMSDIVQNNETGYVVDPHDEKAWAECIVKILQNPDVAEKMGGKGKNVLDTKYTQDSMYEKLEKMYNEVLEIDSYQLVDNNSSK